MTLGSHIDTCTKESPNSSVDKVDDKNDEHEFDFDERIDLTYNRLLLNEVHDHNSRSSQTRIK